MESLTFVRSNLCPGKFWSERSACASATKWPLNQALFLSPLSLSPSAQNHRRGCCRILGGQKLKWANSPRRVCATVLKFFMGFGALGNPPTPPINPILTGKWGNFVKQTLQTCLPDNFRQCQWGAEQRVLCAQTQEQGPPSALAEILVSPPDSGVLGGWGNYFFGFIFHIISLK